MSKIQIKPSCILNVPFQIYDKDFSFIVNGEEFKTSRFLSDLLSPILCRIHINDPTVDTFVINTQHAGNFSRILNLFNFKENEVDDNEFPFIKEVIEKLGNETIECKIEEEETEITEDNAFTLMKIHEKNRFFYKEKIERGIEFISSHLNEFIEKRSEEIESLCIDTLMRILKSDKIKLSTEDQFMKFVNKLYLKSSEYSILYETVLFENISPETMKEFTSIFDINDATMMTWKRICGRLEGELKTDEKNKEQNRYKKPPNGFQEIKFNGEESGAFKGIIRHLANECGGNVSDKNEVIVTSSSSNNCFPDRLPKNAVDFDDVQSIAQTNNEENAWIKYDFKDRKVHPTHYSMRSHEAGKGGNHPQHWVIEGSNTDRDDDWKMLDSRRNVTVLDESYRVHTFEIQEKLDSNEFFRYLRIRQTGKNTYTTGSWYYLTLSALEYFGTIILNKVVQ